MPLDIKEVKDEGFGGPFNFLWWIVKSVCIPLSLPWIFYCFICRMQLRKRMTGLRNKVVVITGASSGIGEALAHSFYAQGCRLVLASRRVEELERVKSDLLRLHSTLPTHPPIVLQLDLADLNSLSGHITKIIDIFGHIDILINNGGISFRGSAASTNIDVDIKIMLVNYFAQIALTKAVIKHMIERKSGHLVYMSSLQGKISLPYRSAYGASKHAIQSFADTLRSEVSKHNIKVTVISPTYVNTSLSLNALTETGKKYGYMDENTKNGISAELVAQKTLEAVVQEKTDLVISSFLPKLIIAVRGTIPSLYSYAMVIRERSSAPKT